MRHKNKRPFWDFIWYRSINYGMCDYSLEMTKHPSRSFRMKSDSCQIFCRPFGKIFCSFSDSSFMSSNLIRKNLWPTYLPASAGYHSLTRSDVPHTGTTCGDWNSLFVNCQRKFVHPTGREGFTNFGTGRSTEATKDTTTKTNGNPTTHVINPEISRGSGFHPI